MNGKQMFCLSLIILSVVMGLHWFKNKPKTKKKPKERPRVALNLDDLQIQDDGDVTDQPDDDPTNEEPDPDAPVDDTGQPADPENPDNPPEENGNASATANIDDVASTTEELRPELNDPIIIALKSMPRNPFEVSPYAKLVEKLRELEDQPEVEEIKKTTSLLQANFSATIRTRRELVAVIDSRLNRKGDDFQNRRITEIGTELVKLDTPTNLFLIPKVGVEVRIATDGTYTFEDSYKKNQ